MCAIKQCHSKRSVENRTRNRTKNVLKPGVVIFASCSAAPSATPYIRPDINRRHKLCTGRSFIVALVTTS